VSMMWDWEALAWTAWMQSWTMSHGTTQIAEPEAWLHPESNWAMEIAEQQLESDEWEESKQPEIDIFAELVDLASDGLSLLGMQTDDLQMRLMHLRECLQLVIKSTAAFHHRPGDDHHSLEKRAAASLLCIDKLLKQLTATEAPPLLPKAIMDLRRLQRHMQDAAVLLCSRFIDQRPLQNRGMSHELISRLEAAFTTEGLQDDLLWSRLGDSKSHLFRRGFIGRKDRRKHRRRGRIHAVRTMYMAKCAAAIEPEWSEDAAATKTELHNLSVDELAAKDLTTVLWTVDDKVITFPFRC
jgi:hypothetical protein